MFFNFSTSQLFNSLVLISVLLLPVYAYEDCVVSTDGKLSDISIEKNDIIDVYPLYTVMNEKNTLFVHPLKAGKTRFCVLKNGKEIVMFNVEVTEESTVIDDVKGFDILTIDVPPETQLTPHPNPLPEEREYDFELDAPPTLPSSYLPPSYLPPSYLPQGGEEWIN